MKRHSRLCLALLVLACAAFDTGPSYWRPYESCRLLAGKFHDGDSFHVRTKSDRTFVFRLYFVDAPEGDESIPGRVEEQAAYFGLTVAQTLELSKQATAFTEEFLSQGFTVYSMREDAGGRGTVPRYFAVIKVKDLDLAAELVARGLARVYGKFVDLPDGTPWKDWVRRLERIEAEAKAAKRGAWGMARPAAPARGGEIRPQVLTLRRSITVQPLDKSERPERVKAGSVVSVVGADPPMMVRVRFRNRDGLWTEGRCRRMDLDL